MRIDVTRAGLLGAGLMAAVLGGGYPGADDDGRDLRAAAPRDVGVIRETTSMRVNRAAHTATPLPDGRVLVVGGFLEKGSAAAAEIYDPSTDAFSVLPPMTDPRHSHTATTLPDGKVLVAGGYGGGTTALASAELFDPRTRTFTPTGALVEARADHVAVPLASGKVLIAGGLAPGWTFLASAEVYDPATGGFTSTGDMTVARESHVAVRLADGRVLVVGGHLGRRAEMRLHASAEVYDPVSGSFTALGAMRVPRHKHDAVGLLDGRVLVTGGTDARDSDGIFDTTEIFDPGTGTFTPGQPMRMPRYKHEGSSVVLPDGRVLIAGGAAQAEVYDPTTGAFVLVPGKPRMAGLFSAAAALPGGGALITGGYGNGGGPRASAWVYR